MATVSQGSLAVAMFEEPAAFKPWHVKLRETARKQPIGVAGALIVILMILMAIFAGVVTPYDPVVNSYEYMLVPPDGNFIFGTDMLGRDVYSRIVYGARTALFVGFASAAVGGFLGLILGVSKRLFRRAVRPHLPACHGCLHGVPAGHHGAGGGVDPRHRHGERDPGDHRALRSQMRARGALVRAPDPRNPLYRRGQGLRLRPCAHHPAPHGAECHGALPHHGHGLCGAGDPDRGRRSPISASACRSRRRPGG